MIKNMRKKLKKLFRNFLKKIFEKFFERDCKKILLLTNLNSDNVGDQIIEACDISLISTVMKNLGFKRYEYKINSREASFIKNAKRDKSDSIKIISNTDVVLFGGAPMFNYDHQIFYENTATIVEYAEKAKKPVVFSAIGIEGYDEDNIKCQRLKKALNLPCVEQMTTRDDLVSLSKYNDIIPTYLVSDPAVFSSTVFKKFVDKKLSDKKRIGLFVARRGICVDNHIPFDAHSQMEFWKKVVKLLEKKGYDYSFLTTGHFSDEAFMVSMHDSGKFKKDKFVFNMNMPEVLVREIRKCDAIIAFRLHANIVAYSFEVPSIGLIWNPKIPLFFEQIKYPERTIDLTDYNEDMISSVLDSAIAQGVKRDTDYLVSVYITLFNALKKIFAEDKEIRPFSYEKLLKQLERYKGTSEEQEQAKLKRKFMRTYRSYNKLNENKEKTNKV